MPDSGESPLLEGVNLTLAAGEWVALTGPSGCGKTTILSISAGLLLVQSGEVNLLGKRLSQLEEPEVAKLRSRVGLVFQNYHLDETRNAEENILLAAFFSDRKWSELRSRALELAKELGLSKHLHQPVSVLSGGQKQRVAIARSLLNYPEILLADEPTGALDEANAETVLALLESERSERSMGILTVTHDNTVQKRADRILEVAHGCLVSKREVSHG